MALGTAVVVLPLRQFLVGRWFGGLGWLILASSSVAFWDTGTQIHMVLGTLFLFVLVTSFALHASRLSVRDALQDMDPTEHPQVDGIVGACIVVAAFASGAALCAFVLPHTWLANENGAVIAAVSIAGLALLVGIVAAVMAAVADGIRILGEKPPITSPVPPIGWTPRRPAKVDWSLARRPHRRVSGADLVQEVLKRVVHQIHNATRVSAGFVVYLLFLAVYALKRGIRWVLYAFKTLGFWVARIARRVAWTIAETLRSLRKIAARTTGLALRSCCGTLLLVGVPLALLTGAAWLAIVSAEETRHYLTQGAIAALGELSVANAIALLFLTGAWISLAGLNRLRISVRSAADAAPLTSSYALLLVAIGGWVVGLPGTLGYGVIHVGWVTAGSTLALIVSFFMPERSRRAGGATPAAAGPGQP